jgi:DNA polymerase-3 subunit delta'
MDVIDRTLLDMMSVYRDVLVLQVGAGVELVNADLRAELQRLAEQWPPEETLRRMEAIGSTRDRIAEYANVNLQLALEAMTLRLVGAA